MADKPTETTILPSSDNGVAMEVYSPDHPHNPDKCVLRLLGGEEVSVTRHKGASFRHKELFVFIWWRTDEPDKMLITVGTETLRHKTVLVGKQTELRYLHEAAMIALEHLGVDTGYEFVKRKDL